ncbi:hypothetical protein UFOVP2_48 [uncultured Caudovirales phage]|uniref:Uncharacterized protein n=1 Tax=uncultured Caudovirales phage TaxID=2100421 RepID=A0A6J5KG12_9CAUD|nr:hypothetical protein UFOVP2_48 [uncultured Caudovirales phage]
MSSNYYEEGGWDAQCFRCGSKRKASELRKQWQGFWVCQEHWEPRHPQDFVKAVPDNSSVPWSQPENWTPIVQCTVEGHSAIPGFAIPGCMTPSATFTGLPSFCTITSVLAQADIGSADCATVSI